MAASTKRTIDFVLAGFPKGGTSSIFSWLDAHPQLQGSVPKEPFFLMDDAHPLAGQQGALLSRDGWKAYETFFPEPAKGRLRFEATTHYFYQETARKHLASLDPQPLVIFVLREPAQRLLSSFRYTRDNLGNCDRRLSFDQYVDCLLSGELRGLDRYYRAASSCWIAKRELEFGRYVEWLDWWLEVLDPRNLEVVLFEEVTRNPAREMARLARRLGIDETFYADFEFGKKNATYRVAHQGLHRFVRRLALRIPPALRPEGLKRRYIAWQGRGVREEAYESGLAHLRQYFLPWIRRLADNYDLDVERAWGVTAWR
jgi:hypothetical protein